MKPPRTKARRFSSWVALVNLSALLACGGVSSIGSGASAGAGTTTAGDQGYSVAAGGTNSTIAGSPTLIAKAGSTSGGSPATDVSLAEGGSDSSTAGSPPLMAKGGTTNAGGEPNRAQCERNADCPGFDDLCPKCADGAVACDQAYCDVPSGTCKRTGGSCLQQCKEDNDCSVPDLGCTGCGDGSNECATSQCQSGFCQVAFPGCAGLDPCQGLACGSACKTCAPDGVCDPLMAGYCSDDGKCMPGSPSCGACQTATDCGIAPPDCSPCWDDSCAAVACIGGKCSLGCPNPNVRCTYNEDCPVAKMADCTPCPSGKCAVSACIQSACILVCPVN